MNELPARYMEWLGGEGFLKRICPGRENRGGEVKRVLELPEEELAGGLRVACTSSLELVRGGLLYAMDALTPAHEIFQGNASALGSYWHGMMHRREGDFGNACYWFRTAGRVAALAAWPEFDPVSFTMRCSRSRGEEVALAGEQRREWECLMRYCLDQALGLGRA